MTRQKMNVLLLSVFALVLASSLSIAAVNPVDAPPAATQVESPSVVFNDPTPENNSVLVTELSQYAYTLNYTAVYSTSGYFYNNLTYWNGTTSDLAVIINGDYNGALGSAGAMNMSFSSNGTQEIEIHAGCYGSGYSNTTVSVKLVYQVFLETAEIITEIQTVTASEAPGFTALIAIFGVAAAAAVTMLIRKRK